jgi:hypothetical protein
MLPCLVLGHSAFLASWYKNYVESLCRPPKMRSVPAEMGFYIKIGKVLLFLSLTKLMTHNLKNSDCRFGSIRRPFPT